MRRAQVLGMDNLGICILADLLYEMDIADHLNIYLNISMDKTPWMPVKEFSYSVHQQNSMPNPRLGSYFGASGPKNKHAIFNYYLEKVDIMIDNYLTIVHPSSYVAQSSVISNAVLIEPQVAISSQTSIGFGVTIRRNASVGHHNIIGEFSDINPGATLCGSINVGKGCIIGANAVLKDGVSIGENTIIGMGSVVTKNIPPNSIAYGNPCQVIKPNDEWRI